MKTASVKVEGFERADKALAQIPIELRGRTIKSALRQAGNIVVRRAKQLCPPPGYPGDKPGMKALRDTLGVDVKDVRETVMAIVGPKWVSPRARHGHLVEFGHQMVAGGTRTRTRKTKQGTSESVAGITARGRRFLESEGYVSTGTVRGWRNRSTGERVRFGTHFKGVQLRGGGRVVGQVPPSPFLEPAAEATRREQTKKVFDAITASVERIVSRG